MKAAVFPSSFSRRAVRAASLFLLLVATSTAYPAESAAAEVLLIPVALHDVDTAKQICGYIDTDGRLVIEPQFETADKFHEGLALVKTGGKFGFINATGAFAIQPTFKLARRFSEGLALVQIDDKFGYIDLSGNIVIPPKFDSSGLFFEGLAIFISGGKRGYLDRGGKVVVPPLYHQARRLSEGLAAVSPTPGRWGFIDSKGKTVIPPRFEGYALDTISDFKDGLAVAQLELKVEHGLGNRWEGVHEGQTFPQWIVINKAGAVLWNTRLTIKDVQTTRGFSEGVAVFGGAHAGWITREGRIVRPEFPGIPHRLWGGTHPAYINDIRDFHDGLAAVKVNDTWGLIDKQGQLVLPPKYGAVGDYGAYVKGFTWVVLNGKRIHRSLNKVIWDGEAKWDSATRKLVR
jgi:hypothetical protein